MHVIHADAFHRWFWRDAQAQSPVLQEIMLAGDKKHPGFTDILADLFQLLHQPAPVWQPPSQPTLHETLLHELVGTKEFGDLKYLVGNDIANAIIGTQVLGARLMEKLTDTIADRIEEEWMLFGEFDEAVAALRVAETELADDPLDAALQQAEQGARAQLELTEQHIQGLAHPNTLKAEIGVLRREVRAAAPEAIAKIQELAELEALFGRPDADHNATGTRGGALHAKLALADRVRQSTRLKRIAEMAGRMQRIALAKKRSVVRTNKDEIIGISVGRDLARTLPVEMAMLGRAETRPIFFKKFHEGQLQTYDMTGSDQLGKGPFVVCVDSTGSMRENNKETWAKSVVMGFLAIAEEDKRDVLVCQFGATEDKLLTWQFLYKTDPRSVTRGVTLDFVETFMDAGGTDLEKPLRWAAEQIALPDKPANAADVILLTDGISNFSARFLEEWSAARKRLGFHTFGILIGSLGQLPIMKLAIENVAYVSDFLRDDEAMDLLFRH